MATLARGGRLNVFGFVLRLAARLPFLFIGGRMYGAAALGRFAYAVLIGRVRRADRGARPAARARPVAGRREEAGGLHRRRRAAGRGDRLGGRNGDPLRLSQGDVPDDARWRAGPVAGDHRAGDQPGPTSRSPRSPITMTSDRRSARGRSSNRGRSASSPCAAGPYVSARRRPDHRLRLLDGRGARRGADSAGQLLRHAARMEAGPAARLGNGGRATSPVAAADAVEWASRRIDLAVLGAFMPASFVGIYYVAQQVATLPAKLKTSFEPVLGPAIARQDRGGGPCGSRQAGAAGDLLDHRRAARDRARARGFPGAR